MKDFIFVTWLYFQILLVQCDIFVNNLNGSNAPIKMCIQKTINHLFSENDTLSLILNNNNLCEDAIFEMSTMHRYIVLNLDVINDVNKLQYEGQFIICSKDVYSLNRTIYDANVIADRNMRTMGNSKILVITNATDADASVTFGMFWYYSINNVIILVYGQRRLKLLTCDRFAPVNECGKRGKTAKLMINQDCEEQLSLSFTNVIHQMNKCPINLLVPEGTVSANENHADTRVIQYVLKELSHHLNATFQRIMFNDMLKSGLFEGMNVFKLGTEKAIGNDHFTEPLIRVDILWLVPKAGQISNMDVFLLIFTYDVWIAASVVFICVALMWCLFISRNGGFTFNKLCLSFLNVWSLTIFGNVAQLPRPTSLALRVLLLFYLFYAIQMQFAFTSDMSTVLTAPRYEFQIRNLEELADSQLPIYAHDSCVALYFRKNYTDRKLYTKLQNSIHVVTIQQHVEYLFNLHVHRNYAVLAPSSDIWYLQTTKNEKIEGYKITDGSISPTYKIHLQIIFNHCFKTTLNTFITSMIESGIHEKRINDFYRSKFDAESTTPADDLITLKHLSFIFVFFGFGLCTACVVFCCELVLHKHL